MRRFFQGLLFLLMWGLLLGGGWAVYEVHRFLSAPASDSPQEIVFSITPGATFDRVAWDLKKAGLITDVTRFRLLARYHDALGRIRAGDYLLSSGWTPDQVLRQITEGRAMLFRLSIREGLTWWETAQAVADQGFARFEDFKEVIHDPEFLRGHSIPFTSAEGFLYPETYLLKKPRSPLDKQQAREVADIMVRMFWKKTEPLWRQMPLRSGPGPGQLGVPLLPPTPGAMDSSPQPGGAPLPAPVAAPPASSGTDASLPDAAHMNPPDSSGGYSATLPDSGPPARVPSALPDEHNPGRARENAASTEPDHTAPDGAAEPVTVPAALLAESPPGAAPAASGPGGIYRGNATAATAPPALNATAQTGSEPALPAGRATGTSPAPGVASSANATTPAPPPEPGGPQDPSEVDPKSLRRLVTLASLVEKETGVPEERGRVAGVYANRLRRNMLLQCDPTIIYGIGRSFTGSILRSQIDDPKNPYNTYQHPGLPPGPICSSGLASLQAAFAPEQHDFLYFVATGLDNGHTFTKTLTEHNKAVQVYRSRMRGNKK